MRGNRLNLSLIRCGRALPPVRGCPVHDFFSLGRKESSLSTYGSDEGAKVCKQVFFMRPVWMFRERIKVAPRAYLLAYNSECPF